MPLLAMALQGRTSPRHKSLVVALIAKEDKRPVHNVAGKGRNYLLGKTPAQSSQFRFGGLAILVRVCSTFHD